MASPALPSAPEVIRPAAPPDLPRVLEIEQLCFEKQWNLENFRASLKDLFFVYDPQPIQGFIVTCPCAIARRAVLMRVAVHPQAQGQGVASQLLATTLQSLREKKIKCVELDVEIIKTEVRRLYENFGFKVLKVVNPDEEYETDAFYMMKLVL